MHILFKINEKDTRTLEEEKNIPLFSQKRRRISKINKRIDSINELKLINHS